MTFAAIEWLNISIDLLMVIFFIVCFLMILLILMQRPKQEGLGAAFGTNVTDQVFGARTTNVLQRGTVYLASAFFVLALTLAILIGHRNKHPTLVVKDAKPAAEEAPAAAPVPEKSVAEDAKDAGQPVPVTPETPAPAIDPAAPAIDPAAPAVVPSAPVVDPAAPAVPAPAPAETPAPQEEKPPGQ
jgi:preprotein translocase subunit SecG